MNIIDNVSISRMSIRNPDHLEHYSENTILIDNGEDYRMQIEEIKLGDIFIGQGKYHAGKEHIISVKSKVDCILSHFCFCGPSITNSNDRKIEMADNQFSLFYKKDEAVTHTIPRTDDKGGSFFQIAIPRKALSEFHIEESRLMNALGNAAAKGENYWVGHNLDIFPAVRNLIGEMCSPLYTGNMKKRYLEAKLMELILAQIGAFDNLSPNKILSLKPADKDRIYDVKAFLDNHIDSDFSIMDLSRMAGINQTKLKKGFKELFGTTIFGYLTDIRMEEAKHLILDEKKYIGEVAELVGYQHPHHFSAAFKRKFGYSPGELKTY